VFYVEIMPTNQVPTVFTVGEVLVATLGILTSMTLSKGPLPLSMCHRYWNHQAFVGLMAKGWTGRVSVTPWQSGRALAWDVTCCDIFAPTYTTLAATGDGLVANRAEDRKVRLYREVEVTHVFIPMPI
jgi:hypothetical protein